MVFQVFYHRFFLIGLLFAVSCTRSNDRGQSVAVVEPVAEKQSFFVTTPLVKYTLGGIPCLQVDIEEQSYCLKLDSGSDSYLQLDTEIVSKLENKVLLREAMAWGIQGVLYPYKEYKIPECRIGASHLWNLYVNEDVGGRTEGAGLVAAGDAEPVLPLVDGVIGWRCFTPSNLLLDMRHDQIAFCDSWESLAKEGYSRVDFTAVPITLDQFITFNVSVHGKPMVCILDTGATWSVLNTELPEGVTLYERAADDSARATYHIDIQGFDGGDLSFLQIPLPAMAKIDAVLGMDFICNHLIFIDFAGKMMYLSR